VNVIIKNIVTSIASGKTNMTQASQTRDMFLKAE